jgi:hypothetical protein
MVGEIQDMVDKAEGKLCLLLAFTKAPYSDSIFVSLDTVFIASDKKVFENTPKFLEYPRVIETLS